VFWSSDLFLIRIDKVIRYVKQLLIHEEEGSCSDHRQPTLYAGTSVKRFLYEQWARLICHP